jgi:eukaryotic-like serine/threonine-protein kinase
MGDDAEYSLVEDPGHSAASAAQRSDDAPFPLLSERFDVTARIGAGGMGVVFDAWDKQRKLRVALKTLTGFAADALYLFKNEFRSLADVSHPNLVSLHELFSEGGHWFFSMEYIEGMHFLDYIRGPEETPVGFPTAEGIAPDEPTFAGNAVTLASTSPWDARVPSNCDADRLRSCLSQLAEGVLALHAAGILHRDLKSSNVMVTPEGRVAVLDFGLALHRKGRSDEFKTGGAIYGTVPYMSPEQASGADVTEASDWYAVGVMVYEALTGRRPFEGSVSRVLEDKQTYDAPPVTEIARDVPDDLQTICTGLLARDAARRMSGREVLNLLGNEEPRWRATPRAPESDRVFVGRESQLNSLRAAFDAIGRGESSIALLHGSSGMGKSALAERFLADHAQDPDTVILSGRCYEQESMPYKALDSIIDSLLRYLGRLSRSEVAQLMPRDAFALTRIFPVLLHLEAMAAAPQRLSQSLEPQELRRKAFGALRELFGRLGDRHRLVLFIDDVQWGDVDSAALLREVLQPPDSPVLMLLLCYRTEDQDSPCVRALRDLDLPGKTEIPLRPLDREIIVTLAGDLLRPRHADWRSRAEAIAGECGGNPYLAVELAQTEANAPALSLDDMLWQRVEELHSDARQLLEIVAVAGRSIPRTEAFLAAGLPSQDPGVVSLLRSNRLLRATATETDAVETYHDRIRETVTSRIPKARLKQHHASIAVALEASGAADPELLARHFDAGAEPNRALPLYVRAAGMASEALAFDQAAWLYGRALELLSEVGSDDSDSRRDVLIGLAGSLANAGRGKEAADNYLLAAAETTDELQALPLRQHAAYQHCISGYLNQGREGFRDVLAAVGHKLPPPGKRIVPLLLWSAVRMRFANISYRPPKTVSRAITSRADALWFAATGFGMVDLVGGAWFADRAAIEALRARDPGRTLRALAWRACVVGNRGLKTAREVEKLLAACRAILERHPSVYGEAMVEMTIAITNFHSGRRRLTLKHARIAEEMFVSGCPGTQWERSTTRFFICLSLLNTGELSDLERAVNPLLRDARERGDLFTYASIATVVGHKPLLAADRPSEARALIAGALESWNQQRITSPAIYASWAHHEIDHYACENVFRMQDLDKILAEAHDSLLPRVQTIKIGYEGIRSRLALGLAVQGVNRDSNLALAVRDATRLTGYDLDLGKGIGFCLLAGVEGLRGNRAGAVEKLEKAIGIFEKSELDLYATLARLRRGQLIEGEQGNESEREAVARLRASGARAPYRLTNILVPAMDNLILRPPTPLD